MFTILRNSLYRGSLYQSLNIFYLFFIALWNAFNFLENDVKRKNAKLCKLLDAPLLVKEFTKAIEKLSLPSIRTKTFLAKVYKRVGRAERRALCILCGAAPG